MFTPYEPLLPDEVRYCYVVRPDADKSEFPIHDTCQIPKIDKELEANGLWNVVAGIHGKTDELQFQVNVAAQSVYTGNI